MYKLLSLTILALLYCNVLFAASTPNPPTSFTVTLTPGSTDSSIDLAWGKNAANDAVMIAHNTNAVFGQPKDNIKPNYIKGDSITGGGTIIYIGDATSDVNSGLLANTYHYYKIWSRTSDGKKYSDSGLPGSAETTPEPGMVIGLVLGLITLRAKGLKFKV